MPSEVPHNSGSPTCISSDSCGRWRELLGRLLLITCQCVGFSLRKGNVSLSAHPSVCGYTGYVEFLLCLLLNMKDPVEQQLYAYLLLFPAGSAPKPEGPVEHQ